MCKFYPIFTTYSPNQPQLLDYEPLLTSSVFFLTGALVTLEIYTFFDLAFSTVIENDEKPGRGGACL